ncbi:MAG: hypothetical protein HY273_05265 [Gammaproteobacteria bacterium]|nr:hypothetical protein [Gammaproteobacteria bacterium]
MNLDDDVGAGAAMTTDQLQNQKSLVHRRSDAGVAQRLRVLEKEKETLLRGMHALIAEFKTTFREPPAYMVLHRITPGQHIYVRWRRYGRKSSFITPSSASAPEFFRQLEPHTRSVIADFWRHSLDLNLAFALRHLEWTRLRQYLEDVDTLNKISRTRASR